MSDVPDMVLGLLQCLRAYQTGEEPEPVSLLERRRLMCSLSVALDDAATAARALVALEETRQQ